MSYRSDRFNRAMRSVEESANGIDMAKWRVLSDLGIGVERLVDEIDGEACVGDRRTTGQPSYACPHAQINWRGRSDLARQFDDDRKDKLWEAEMRLADAGKSYLIRVLLLIVENGAEREISLRSVPRRTYFRHRDELLSFFSWHSGAHGDIEGHAMPRPVPVPN